jgi:hypothetical protein
MRPIAAMSSRKEARSHFARLLERSYCKLLTWGEGASQKLEVSAISLQGAPACVPMSVIEAELENLGCSWIENYGCGAIWQTSRGYRLMVESSCSVESWGQIRSEIAPYL